LKVKRDGADLSVGKVRCPDAKETLLLPKVLEQKENLKKTRKQFMLLRRGGVKESPKNREAHRIETKNV